MSKSPLVALYPWPIDSLSARDGKASRQGVRNREGDQKFANSFGTSLGWPLGDKKIRLGLVTSKAEPGLDDPRHVWAIAILSKGKKQGRTVVIWDNVGASRLAYFRRKKQMFNLERLVESQQKVLKILKEDKRMTITNLFYGGSSYLPELDWACLEDSLRFVEEFVDKINSSEGKVNAKMLKEFGLELIR